MPKNHISNPYIGIIEMFESENRKSSNQNQKIGIGIIEAEIRIEATQLSRRIVTALLLIIWWSIWWGSCFTLFWDQTTLFSRTFEWVDNLLSSSPLIKKKMIPDCCLLRETRGKVVTIIMAHDYYQSSLWTCVNIDIIAALRTHLTCHIQQSPIHCVGLLVWSAIT